MCRNIKLRKLVAHIFLGAVIVLCSACNGSVKNKNNNISAPVIEKGVSTPYLQAFGNYLKWYEISKADKYFIYQDDKLLAETDGLGYQLGEMEEDSEFYITAYDEEEQLTSEKSNKVLVSQNVNFSEDEILDLSAETSWRGTIPSNIRWVLVEKQELCTVDMEYILAKRDRDITFVLKNVVLEGATPICEEELKSGNPNVILHVTGECGIKGRDGGSWSYTPEINSEEDGIDGGDGKNAIAVANLVVTGTGNLTVQGGNGGNGSDGAGTEGITDKTPGKGSNGGNGGNGIYCKNLFLNMDLGSATVSLHGGSGGEKGLPGNNGSISTGPLISLSPGMWESVYDIGKKGTDGMSLKGNLIKIKGVINY